MRIQKFYFVFVSFSLVILTVLGCGRRTKHASDSSSSPAVLADYYQNSGSDSVHFVRFLKTGSEVKLISGNIIYSARNLTKQVNESESEIKAKWFKSVSKELISQGFREEFDTYQEVMLIQFPIDTGNLTYSVHIQNKLQDQIDREFMLKGYGQWISGDIGEGGANMFFFINDWDSAFQMALSVLDRQGMLNEAIIAKRLNFTKLNWNYHIVYPFDFEGELNSN